MFIAICIHSSPALIAGELDKVFTPNMRKMFLLFEVHQTVSQAGYIRHLTQCWKFDAMNKSTLAERYCEGYRAYEQYYPRIKIRMRTW